MASGPRLRGRALARLLARGKPDGALGWAWAVAVGRRRSDDVGVGRDPRDCRRGRRIDRPPGIGTISLGAGDFSPGAAVFSLGSIGGLRTRGRVVFATTGRWVGATAGDHVGGRG